MKLLLFAAVAPMLFCGCDELKSRLDVAESETGELKVEISQLEKTVADLSDLKAALEVKVTELERQLAAAGDEDAALSSRIDELKETIEELEGNIAGLRTLIDGKVSYAEYAEFVAEVTESLKTLGRVESLCAGFPDGKTVKEYVDDAVAALTSASGSYMLKTEFEEFYGQYSAFVAAHHSAVEALEREIASLEAQIDAIPAGPDMTPYENQIKDLQNRIGELEDGLFTLDEIKEIFNDETNGYIETIKSEIEQYVRELVKDMEVSDDLLQEAVEEAIKNLNAAYKQQIDDLTSRVTALEEKVGIIEGKVDALLTRIQSLVYVPETSDGKIHIGASYIAEIKDGIESNTKISVTSAHKIKYRVSPADLSIGLVKLYEQDPNSFSFWQEHVSRVYETQAATTGLHIFSAETVASRADAREGHDGVHEFNIEDVEEVSPGVIQITVRNEHAFDHEDLAVALCIKHEDAETKVLTEYVSAYTTVVGSGSNLVGRFHLAKKENDSYTKVSRTDRVDYIVIYDDQTTIKLMEGYEVAYDDGENVISLTEAKEKYGWDASLECKIARVKKEGAIVTNYIKHSTIIPADWSSNLSEDLEFHMNSDAELSDVGSSMILYYGVSVYNGDPDKKVTIIPLIEACITVVPPTYTVAATVTWDSDKFYYGTQNSAGWQSQNATYTTLAELKYDSGTGLTSASNLPGSVYKDVFADEPASWMHGSVPDGVKTDDNLNVTATVQNGGLAFEVKGFKYCKGIYDVDLSREGDNGIATSGVKKIEVNGRLTFDGPTSDEFRISLGSTENPITISADGNGKGVGNGTSYVLTYMTAKSDSFTPKEKVLPLNTKFFKSAIFQTAKVESENVICVRQSGDASAPEQLKLKYHNKNGGRPSPLLWSINVAGDNGDDPKVSGIKEETTYKLGNFDIKIPGYDELTIHVTGGAFKFVPKN